jgi:ankyrin repeat protein
VNVDITETVDMCIAAKDNCVIHIRLKEAIEGGETKQVEMVLPYLEDLNTQVCIGDRGHGTPLEIAIQKERPGIICLLLRNGADVNFMSKRHSPLMVACLWHRDMVPCLLRHGADPNIANERGLTALLYTASSHTCTEGKAAVIKHLLEYGADVNVRSNSGSTTLDALFELNELVCTWNGDENAKLQAEFIECACLLLQAGADPALMDPRCYSDRVPKGAAVLLKAMMAFVGACVSSRCSIIPSNLAKLITTVLMAGLLTWTEIVMLYDYIKKTDNEGLKCSVEILTSYLENGLSLKEMCRLELRKTIRSPLLVNYLSDNIYLPKSLKEYIVFKHI